jgi:hypothetical protein
LHHENEDARNGHGGGSHKTDNHREDGEKGGEKRFQKAQHDEDSRSSCKVARDREIANLNSGSRC